MNNNFKNTSQMRIIWEKMEFIVKTLVNVLHKFIWNVTIINLCFHTRKLFGKMRNDRRAIDAMI